MTDIDEHTLAALRALDTPTVCNAIEIVAPERRAVGFTTEPLICARPSLGPIVGFARTATIRGTERPALGGDEMRARRLDYYRYIAEGPRPSIAIIQDLDSRPGAAAFWGEVQTTIHQGLGCIGTVTNGGIRDLDDCAEGFQLLAGRIAPSHVWVHVVSFGEDVTVAGMTVRSGDLIHADRHGAVVIPEKIAREIPAAAGLIARREAVILAAAREPDLTVERLREAFGEADDIH